MKWIIAIIVASMFLILLSFAPLFDTRVKSGHIRVNYWEKQQISNGELILD